jgi:hypothetical protein
MRGHRRTTERRSSMNRDQHHAAARKTDNRTAPRAETVCAVRRKADLKGDKDKTFNEKFTDFIRAHSSEAEGLAAYDALPD